MRSAHCCSHQILMIMKAAMKNIFTQEKIGSLLYWQSVLFWILLIPPSRADNICLRFIMNIMCAPLHILCYACLQSKQRIGNFMQSCPFFLFCMKSLSYFAYILQPEKIIFDKEHFYSVQCNNQLSMFRQHPRIKY